MPTDKFPDRNKARIIHGLFDWSESIMRRALLLLGVWATLASASDAVGVSMKDGYIRLPPPGSPAAGYFTLKNAGPARVLVDADCDCAGMTMLHETVERDGVASMRHVDGVPLAAGGEIQAKPGGLHLMLMRLKAPLNAGDKVTVVLRFADGDTLSVLLPVEAR